MTAAPGADVLNENLACFDLTLSPPILPYAAVAPATLLAEPLLQSLAATTVHLNPPAVLHDTTGAVFAGLGATIETIPLTGVFT